MSVLITGGSGQLGLALRSAFLSTSGGVPFIAPPRAVVDLAADEARLTAAWRALLQQHRPVLVVHAAALTDVDLAQRQPALADRINHRATGILARESLSFCTKFLYISSDQVFDGALARAYREADAPAPLNVYGRSKLAGERAVLQAAEAESENGGAAAWVLRTAWLYGDGGPRWLQTMRARQAAGLPPQAVTDQVGAPTSAAWLANLIHRHWVLGTPPPGGIYHAAAAGEISKHALAERVLGTDVQPVTMADFPQAAPRPGRVLLDCSQLAWVLGIEMPVWSSGFEDQR